MLDKFIQLLHLTGLDQPIYLVADAYYASRKLAAYERFMQVRLIAQGLLQFLALSQPAFVWKHFGSRLRTMNTHQCPSEAVTARALRRTWPEFLLDFPKTHCWRIFLRPLFDPERCPFFRFFKKAACGRTWY